jgi:hypothetical protein
MHEDDPLHVPDRIDDGEDRDEPGAREGILAQIARTDPVTTSIELEKIPQHLWEQTLVPLRPIQRLWVADEVVDDELRKLAQDQAFALNRMAGDEANDRARARHAALRTGHPLPSPAATHASARSSVQVNLRLRGDDHQRLVQAAEAVGLKPTTLARSLVLNGAAMILRDHGREHLAPPPRAIHTPLSLD